MTLQDLMMLYGVTLGRRRSKRQKYLFARQLGEALPPLGYPVQVQERRGRLTRIENLIAGDLDKARVVFVAAFDTPAKALWPGRYYPFHPERTLRDERRDLAARLLLAALLLAAAYRPLAVGWAQAGRRWLLLPGLALLGAGVWQLWGHANRNNFDRFSASVALCAALAQDLAHREGVAFAFCDRSAFGYDGYRLLAQHLPADATVVLLDCLAQGERLVLAHGPRCAGRAEALQQRLPDAHLRAYTAQQSQRNLLALLPNGLLLTSGRVEQGEFFVEHTRTSQDVGLDLVRLGRIQRALSDFAAACLRA